MNKTFLFTFVVLVGLSLFIIDHVQKHRTDYPYVYRNVLYTSTKPNGIQLKNILALGSTPVSVGFATIIYYRTKENSTGMLIMSYDQFSKVEPILRKYYEKKFKN